MSIHGRPIPAPAIRQGSLLDHDDDDDVWQPPLDINGPRLKSAGTHRDSGTLYKNSGIVDSIETLKELSIFDEAAEQRRLQLRQRGLKSQFWHSEEFMAGRLVYWGSERINCKNNTSTIAQVSNSETEVENFLNNMKLQASNHTIYESEASTTVSGIGTSGVTSTTLGAVTGNNNNVMSKSHPMEPDTNPKMGIQQSMNIHHFQQLKEAFKLADEDGSGGLDIDEFREAFGSILGKNLNFDQMTMLFMKIDANSDGTVDWDEFCTYMVLEKKGSYDMIEKAERLIFAPHLKKSAQAIPHKEILKRICWIPKEKKFLSLSQDGTACLWKDNLKPHRIFGVQSAMASAWVTDAEYLSDVQKLVVAFDDRQISFYDPVSNESQVEQRCLMQMKPFDNVPLCLGHVPAKDTASHKSFLLFGDDRGNVTVMTLPSRTAFSSLPPIMNPQRLSGYEDTFTLVRRKAHNNWVSRIQYLPGLKAYASSSVSRDRSLVIGDVECKSERILSVHRGVDAFDYCHRHTGLLVTGGADRIVRLWNPYILSKPAGIMHGHASAIIHIIANNELPHVISVSVDKIIKVWDVRMQKCLQTFADKVVHRPDDVLSVAYFDQKNQKLVTGLTTIDIWPTHSTQRKLTARSHNSPICRALYNVNFHQVVSGCIGSTINVWDVVTGCQMFQYSSAQSGGQDNMEISCMIFDTIGRRLITGSWSGVVKVWNFNNGQCLKVMAKVDNLPITDLAYIEVGSNSYVAAVGWNRKVTIFDDTDDNNEVMRELPDKKWGLKTLGHRDDIHSMAFCPPNILATCAADGEIIIWNFDSGFAKHYMTTNPLARRRTDIPERHFGGGTAHPKTAPPGGNRCRAPLHKSDTRASLGIDSDDNYDAEDDDEYGGVSSQSFDSEHSFQMSMGKKNFSHHVSSRSVRSAHFNSDHFHSDYDDIDDIDDSCSSTRAKSAPRHRSNSARTGGTGTVDYTTYSSNGSSLSSTNISEKSSYSINKEGPGTARATTAPAILSNVDSSVEKIMFLPFCRHNEVSPQPLISLNSDGRINLWNVRTGSRLGGLHANHSKGAIMTTMCTDLENNVLITADANGMVKTWNISNYFADKPEQDPSEDFTEIATWRAHVRVIMSTTYVEEKHLVLTSSVDCTVRVWTLFGGHIGIFGQPGLWSLNCMPDPGKNLPPDIEKQLQEEEEDRQRQEEIKKIEQDINITHEKEVMSEATSQWRAQAVAVNKLTLGRKYFGKWRDKMNKYDNDRGEDGNASKEWPNLIDEYFEDNPKSLFMRQIELKSHHGSRRPTSTYSSASSTDGSTRRAATASISAITGPSEDIFDSMPTSEKAKVINAEYKAKKQAALYFDGAGTSGQPTHDRIFHAIACHRLQDLDLPDAPQVNVTMQSRAVSREIGSSGMVTGTGAPPSAGGGLSGSIRLPNIGKSTAITNRSSTIGRPRTIGRNTGM